MQRMGVNLMTGIARFHRQIPIGVGKCIEDPNVIGEVLTIIGGLCRARESHSARDRYAKEARKLPQTLVHKADKHPTINTQGEFKDIILTKTDSMWVHHPHIDALVIIVRMANSNVHRMLVDNGSSIDILYRDAYKKTCMTESDLSPTTSPLYGFTRGHVIPRGTIKLVVTVPNIERGS